MGRERGKKEGDQEREKRKRGRKGYEDERLRRRKERQRIERTKGRAVSRKRQENGKREERGMMKARKT